MSRYLTMTPPLEHYVRSHARESDVAQRLREETSALPQAGMQIGPDQAAFLAMLVRSIDAKRCIEVGTFTGYSALAIASVLPDDGKLICCDVSEEWTAIAQRYWTQAGVANRIDLRLAPALDTLNGLIANAGIGKYDFAFIDADKSGYDAYYEACLKLLRRGGLIALDNMLWSGKVAENDNRDSDTVALRALNAKIRDDARVDAVLLALADGVMLARKR